MFKGLSLEQAPPFEAPLLFFILATIFAAIGAMSMLFDSSFGTLHLITLGFMAMVMMGALQQMLPVVVGVNFQKPWRFSLATAIPIAIGIVSFYLGFCCGMNSFLVAAIFLGVGLTIFIAATIFKLIKVPHSSATVWGMRLALISFLIALLLGLHFLSAFALQKGFSNHLALMHALFALGWVALLIIGVSYQVISMFYVTKEPKNSLKLFFVFTPFFLMLATAALITTKFALLSFTALLIVCAIYAIMMLKLLWQRKRAIKEASIYFWYLGLSTLILLPFAWWIDNERATLLFLFGFGISIIFGMLYKIIPFLSWFHISSRGFFDMPTMKEMVNEKMAQLHFWLHAITLISLFIDYRLTGLLFGVSVLLLAINLYNPIKIYLSYKKRPSPFGS